MTGCEALGCWWGAPNLTRRDDGRMGWTQTCVRCHTTRPVDIDRRPDSEELRLHEAARMALDEWVELKRSRGW